MNLAPLKLEAKKGKEEEEGGEGEDGGEGGEGEGGGMGYLHPELLVSSLF